METKEVGCIFYILMKALLDFNFSHMSKYKLWYYCKVGLDYCNREVAYCQF